MKRVFIFLTVFICITVLAYGQKTSSVWYFGKGIGVNFNTSPPTALYNSATALEGCASIADGNGNLLFYTNGEKVFSKNHSVMLNGFQLFGNLSSTDNVVIAALPGSETLYYIFTIGEANELSYGLNYSIVDMSLNNGLGEVTEKNVQVFNSAMEKIAAVRHCNKKDVWICVKEWGTSAYYTYLLTSAGLSAAPVVSNMGLVINGDILNTLGALRFSSDGSKLAAMHSFENDIVQLMRFDNQTGVLSDPIFFKVNTNPLGAGYPGTYGAAFSFDNRLLYVSSRTSSSESSVLYQFDISSHNTSTILASKYIIESNASWNAGGLQQAPDGKIYYSQWKNSALSVINNPDVQGSGCNFQSVGVNFSGSGREEPLQLGLPNFIASDIDSNFTEYSFEWNDIGGCNGVTLKFIPNNISGADSIKWDFGDGNHSSDPSPVHTYYGLDDYTVTMHYYKQNCGTNSYSITRIVTVSNLDKNVFLPNDTSFCEGNEIIIKAIQKQNTDSLIWSTGDRADSIIVSAPGIYWLDVYQGTCTFRDSIVIQQERFGLLDLGEDKKVCSNQPATFSVNIPGPATFTWNTGSTASSINVTTPGLYWVEVKSPQGCVSRDSVRATSGDCKSFIPSAFTPNGDGLNDTFGLLGGINTNIFKLQVFNRYGDVVFSTKNPSEKWDGKVKGKPAPTGNYIWVMEYKNNEGFIQTDRGSVLLLH